MSEEILSSRGKELVAERDSSTGNPSFSHKHRQSIVLSCRTISEGTPRFIRLFAVSQRPSLGHIALLQVHSSWSQANSQPSLA